MIIKRTLFAILLAGILVESNVTAQNHDLTKEQILNMSTEELSELPLEDLMKAVELLGVSSIDELFNLIMNKNVSSASKKEEDSFRSPLSSTVITHDEMRTYGVSTIEEAFRLIPGMIVTEKTNGIYDIQMRGLNNIPDNNMFLYTENANSLIMIDGRPVQSYAMGSVNFDQIPIDIEDVERIEVVRGACSALYGANAVTGVINIITQKPDKTDREVSGSIQLGNQNTYVGNIALRHAFSDVFAAGVSYSMQYRERPTDKLWVMPSSGVYLADPDAFEAALPSAKQTPGAKLSYYQLSKVLRSSLTDVSNGAWVSVDDLENLKQVYSSGDDYRIFDCLEPETPARSMFPHPELARKTIDLNGYVSIKPSANARVDLSGGYQNSFVNTTPVGSDYFTFNGRRSKTYYAAAEASLFDLHLLANYSGGCTDYAVGVPGFKARQDNVNASAEYDFELPFGLTIRPGFSYQDIIFRDCMPEWNVKSQGENRTDYSWHYEDSYNYRYAEDDHDHLSGFFITGTNHLRTLAPSLRLDYQNNGLRVIAAFRNDKTNLPDIWTPSWQGVVSYSLNGKNFFRLVYGRANRGTNMVNSATDFEWTRTNLVYPSKLHFAASENPDFVKIDNFELGYRVKPVDRVLVDFEAFYSISKDFGALMADYGTLQVSQEKMNDVVDSMESMVGSISDDRQDCSSDVVINYTLSNLISSYDLGLILKPYAGIKYQTLPYEVHQMGASVNVDYIISSKLILKLNANWQQTKIDNYYVYNQNQDILAMLAFAQSSAMEASLDAEGEYEFSGDLSNIFSDIMYNYANDDELSFADASNEAFSNWNTWDLSKGVCEFGRTSVDHVNSLPEEQRQYFYETANGVRYYTAKNAVARPGESVKVYTTQETVNGKTHKATPSFYGMLGLIFKPVPQLEVSAFCNYIGKRTYATSYCSDDLAQRCTVNMKVGYKPAPNFELFVNAHNLLNNRKREFTQCDEIPGIYTVGVSFGL